MTSCTFDSAIRAAWSVIQDAFPAVLPDELLFVRDMNGRVHVVVPDTVEAASLDALRPVLAQQLGAYSPGLETGLERLSATVSGAALLDEPCQMLDVVDASVRVLDRRVLGGDWIAPRAVADARPKGPKRVSFYGLSAGLGRSTALFLWGRELAAQGRRVLLVDLDFESPWLGPALLPLTHRPEYGIVDWLVEDLVGNAIAQDWVDSGALLAPTPLSESGRLYVAPAAGQRLHRKPGAYLAKLARAYLEGGPSGGASFPARVRRLLSGLERVLEPDIVLIDSPAGLGEAAATALVHLDAEALLFATDTAATWEGYAYLLAELAQRPGERGDGRAWCQKLRMVYAKAPPTDQAVERFREHAHALWQSVLYARNGASRFGDDPSAPHAPIVLPHRACLSDFDPPLHWDRICASSLREAVQPFMDAMALRLSTS